MAIPTNLREDLKVEYQELLKTPFPKLGYKVEGLPEAGSVLAGFVTQAFNPTRRIALDADPIFSSELADKVANVCQAHRGSQEAAELEAYVEKVKSMEAKLRRLVAVQNEKEINRDGYYFLVDLC